MVMREFAEHFKNRITKIPMAVVLIPFALGIFLIDTISAPLWLLILTCIASLVGAAMLTKWWQNIALFVMLFSAGALLHSLSYNKQIEYYKPLRMSLEVETSSVIRNGYTSAEATIAECEDGSLVEHKVVLWSDSLTQFSAGDRLKLTTEIRPFRQDREQYSQLMHHRGFVGSLSIDRYDDYEYIPTQRRTIHDWAVERLRKGLPMGDSRAVVLAMVTGERGEINSELRQNYSASGASHLLAVSGLHIGIAFMLINILLLPLVLLHYGNVVRSIVAIAFIWLYVWLCGMSPSAVRAAIVFSLLQLSLSSLRDYIGINILAGAAFVMLIFDSHLLFDISFQLSFIAVTGILLWGIPLYHICSTRFKIVNALLGVVLIGIASTFATMPLVAHTFATISVVGILINPVVIFLANIIVLAGVVALAFPFMGVVAEWAASLQNIIVEWAASLPYGHFEASISEGVMWGMYALLAVTIITLWLLPKPEKELKIEG